MDSLAVYIFLHDPVLADLLIGQLSEMGFTGFEERDDGLIAFVSAADSPEQHALEDLLRSYHLIFKLETIPSANWNAEWEHSFSPVLIDDFCGIRASFHHPLSEVRHEIIITPRMTFGTGHHATTASMIRLMRELELKEKSVFDFGTGTGILAILAAKMGATKIVAIDKDYAAVENARGNAKENGVSDRIFFADGDQPEPVYGIFDYILVNIQLQVILQYLPELLMQLRMGGLLLLSGILEKDCHHLYDIVQPHHVKIVKRLNTEGWVALMLQK